MQTTKRKSEEAKGSEERVSKGGLEQGGNGLGATGVGLGGGLVGKVEKLKTWRMSASIAGDETTKASNRASKSIIQASLLWKRWSLRSNLLSHRFRFSSHFSLSSSVSGSFNLGMKAWSKEMN
jgi:hypothetical protein